MVRSRGLRSLLLLLPLMVGAALVFFPRQGGGEYQPTPARSSAPAVGLGAEELLFLLQYVGSDYTGAVRDGAVLDEMEYQEMLDFTATLVSEYSRLDSSPGSVVAAGLARLRSSVERKEDPAKVLGLTRELVARMTEELRLSTYPAGTPSIDRGAFLYQTACAQCHGERGDGQGRSAAGQDPPPTSFRESRMQAVAPHQLYNAIGFGIEGTSMPSFESAFGPDQRWDVAFYLMTLRDDFSPRAPESPVSLSVRDLATRSDQELMSSEGLSAETLDHTRRELPEISEAELLRMAQKRLDASYRAYEEGDRDTAVRLSLEAYLQEIEPAEVALAGIDSGLVRDLERELARYRASLREGAPPEEVATRASRLRALTEDAAAALEESGSGFGLVSLQAAAIILREGIEAALLVALLLSYLAAAGRPELRRPVVGGAVAGILGGILTWIASTTLIATSTLQREALEGITSLLAAAVLFSVSLWILHQADLQKWKGYLETRARTAAGSGRALGLAAVSFLAVYREAFETVLFFQALWLRSGAAGTGALLLGLALGTLVLGVLIVAMFQYGKRIPLKPFFAATGILLGLLSLSFAGYGIRELQKIGWVQESFLEWVPYVPLLELQPTLEGLSLQLGIFLSFLLSWFSRAVAGYRLPVARSARSH